MTKTRPKTKKSLPQKRKSQQKNAPLPVKLSKPSSGAKSARQTQNSPPPQHWVLRDHLSRFIREYFHSKNYLEIDTPIVVCSPGTEVHLSYFETAWEDHGGRNHPGFLRSSPELHLKQAMSLGFDRVFHLAKCFRNRGELSPWHHPEFTMLEWYQSGFSLTQMIAMTEGLIRETFEATRKWAKKNQISLPGTPQLPKKNFPRFSVFEAFYDFANVELIDNDADLASKCIASGVVSVQPKDDFESAYFKTLIEKIEPALVACGAAVLYDYPESQAALACLEGNRAKRFEIYVGRVELCNGFQELLGAEENRQRIGDAAKQRHKAGLVPVPEDLDFYEALKRGIPPCSGNALGFDRLIALAAGAESLDRVIPFRDAVFYRK